MPPCRKCGTLLDENFKLYMNHCHCFPACKHFILINMHNSLFRLLILFDVSDELQLIDLISLLGAPPLEILGTTHTTKLKSTTDLRNLPTVLLVRSSYRL